MKITLSSSDITVSIEKKDSNIEEVVDSFISCMILMDYEEKDIKQELIRVAEILKNNHKNESDKNSNSL